MHRSRYSCAGCVILILLTSVPLLSQPGYRIDRQASQVVIDQARHWRAWAIPELNVDRTVEISAAGKVTPRFWRKNTNAMLDIVDYLRANPPNRLEEKKPEQIIELDAVTADSNRRGVLNVMDERLDTYWEPEPLAPGVDPDVVPLFWWFSVDLGRVVVANKVVAKFVEEGMGDPFLMFDVLVSTGEKPKAAPGGEAFDFAPVIRTLRPNKSQRQFEVDLTELGDAEVGRQVVRAVQVVVRASDLDRGREMDKAEYDELAAADAGAIVHTQRLVDGGEIEVSPEIYEQLHPDRRGPVRYFRRERPRLTELEVWGLGDEILSGAVRRGGSISNSTLQSGKAPENLLDGDITSRGVSDLSHISQIRIADEIFVDLGSSFWIDAQRMLGGDRSFQGRGFDGYRVRFSDGSREADGQNYQWTTVAEADGGRKGYTLAGHDFAPVKARFFSLDYDVHVHQAGQYKRSFMSEMQLYGEGYQPEVSLTSNLIELGDSFNLASIEWDADTPPGTAVVLQTRTGAKVDEVYAYYREAGGKKTLLGLGEEGKAKHEALKFGKGPIELYEIRPSEEWEPWSAPYLDPEGSPITSPSPQPLLVMRATLISDDPNTHATLNSIRLNFDEPVAQQIVGEVSPRQVETLGEPRPLSLLVEFEDLNFGFDELLLTPPSGVELGFSNLYIGRLSDLEEGADLSALTPVEVDAVADGDSLWVSFAPTSRRVEALRLEFTGTLYSPGGRLRASLRRSDRGAGFWQRVDEKVQRNSLTLVAATQSKELFADLQIPSPVFTPNGDGVNDQMSLEFTLFLVPPDTGVQVEIFDLSGRSVHRFVERREASTGTYSIRWDGADEAGNLLPPGLYALRVSLETSTADTDLTDLEALRTIAIAY